MHLCVTDIECVYLYDFTITMPAAILYLCDKDIVFMCMTLPVLIQERSYICVLMISNVSICMILPLLSQEWSGIYVLRISNVSICMILPVLSQERSCICVLRISCLFVLFYSY